MKQRISYGIACLALLCALLTPSATASDAAFPDVPATHWAATYIETLSTAGIVRGLPDGSFAPEATVSRAEFLTMLARVCSGESLPEAADGEDWWQPAYDYAAQLGLLDEVAFAADSSEMNTGISRYEIAQLLVPLIQDDAYSMMDAAFTDLEGGYASLCAQAAAKAGLLTGYPDGTFRGEGTLTRAEASAVLCRLVARTSLPEGFQFLYSWGDVWLLEQVGEAETVLRTIDSLTGETVNEYTVPLDITAEDLDAEEGAVLLESIHPNQLDGCDGTRFWGGAGLYEYREGRFVQLSQRTVIDCDYDGETYLLVTHAPGQRLWVAADSVFCLTGNMVVQLDADGTETVILSDTPDLGLRYRSVSRAEDGTIYLTTIESYGKSSLSYLYSVRDGRVYAEPSDEVGLTDRDEAATAAEQARLDAITQSTSTTSTIEVDETLSAETVAAYYDYFNYAPHTVELDTLPVFALGGQPDWDGLTQFIHSNAAFRGALDVGGALDSYTFGWLASCLFEDLTYTDHSSSYLTWDGSLYTVTNGTGDGYPSVFHRLIGLEDLGGGVYRARFAMVSFSEIEGLVSAETAARNRAALQADLINGEVDKAVVRELMLSDSWLDTFQVSEIVTVTFRVDENAITLVYLACSREAVA